MSLISHLLILLSYALIAAAVAFGLPQTVPVIERATAYLIGGIVFVGSALLHEVYARGLGREALADELYELRADHVVALAELEAMQEKIAA